MAGALFHLRDMKSLGNGDLSEDFSPDDNSVRMTQKIGTVSP